MQVGKRMKINDDWRIGCIFCATMEFVDYGRIWCPTSVSSWRCTTLIVLWHIERLLRYDVSYVETLQNVCYDVILYNVGCAVTSPTYVTSWRRQRSLHRDVANVRYIVTSLMFVTSWRDVDRCLPILCEAVTSNFRPNVTTSRMFCLNRQ